MAFTWCFHPYSWLKMVLTLRNLCAGTTIFHPLAQRCYLHQWLVHSILHYSRLHTQALIDMVCKCKRVHGTNWNTLLLHLVSGSMHFQSWSCSCYILSGCALSLYNTYCNTRRDHFQLRRKMTWELQLLSHSPAGGIQL